MKGLLCGEEKIGAPGENRTPTSDGNAILSRARLPVPPQEQTKKKVM
jgi:hypothetical protein